MNEERLYKIAKDAEAKRRAGTHVFHPRAHLYGGDPYTGLIEKEKARALIGRECRGAKEEIRPEHFSGDPETGVVSWTPATQTAPQKGPLEV